MLVVVVRFEAVPAVQVKEDEANGQVTQEDLCLPLASEELLRSRLSAAFREPRERLAERTCERHAYCI